jgi:ADP-ribosylglycohydrolase/transcriptional regulator with XRE-family HTH domain
MIPNPKVTLDDIAAQAGVSVAAVSQVLSGKGRISEATRERVLAVVEQLSYKPDRAAQALARRRASAVELAGASDVGMPPTRRKGRDLVASAILSLMHPEELRDALRMEARQLEEEGCDLAAWLPALDAANAAPLRRSRLHTLYLELANAPARPGFSYCEPSSLEEIRAARPAGPRARQLSLTRDVLRDRALGAWQGRVVGCVLGRPVESGWSKSQMLEYLRCAGSLPVEDYIPRVIPAPPGLEPNPAAGGAFRGEIGGAPADDDTDYTILAGHLLEEYGIAFTTANVATEWLSHLAYFNTYTAERAALRNLALNIPPEEAAFTVNPCREYIGARIRADMYGMACPGLPELAAELAYRDAILSHTRNGIYAAMFMAATLAWCYVTADVAEAVRAGLSEIPANCRLAEAIRDVLSLCAETPDWEIAYDRLILKLGGYHPVHSINNTAWLVLALLAGRGDFDATMNVAICCGFDTDCNAANAGAVVGLMRGAGAIAPKWLVPLVDSLRSLIAGCPELPISEAAARTAALAERTLLSH